MKNYISPTAFVSLAAPKMALFTQNLREFGTVEIVIIAVLLTFVAVLIGGVIASFYFARLAENNHKNHQDQE